MSQRWIPITAAVCGGVAVIVVAVLLLVFLLPKNGRAAGKGKGKAQDGAKDGDAQCNEPRRVVMLKSDKCSHCRALLPVVRQLQSQGVTIDIVDGPSTFDYDWYVANGIQGFPTICELQGKKVLDIFTGRRTADAIAKYCQDRAQRTFVV
jgi:hypothetical protein